jgi:hypothetical protein
MKGNNILYISAFLFSVILMNMITGSEKATYTYLILVLISVIFYNWNKYKITIDTPDILK